jgi:hypothetical protein
MAKSSAWIAGVGVALILSCVAGGSARGGLVLARRAGEGRAVSGADTARKEIEAFNRKFIDAHLKMDNAAVMGMWADDGVSLLPATSPMVGKQTIAKFLEDVVAKMPGYHMRKIEIDFQGIETSGNWASEWATEHQIVDPPPGKRGI